MSHRAYSVASDSESESCENVYCIFLHVVEGIGLASKEGVGDFCDRQKDKIILNASLNGVKFEVEGHSTETTTIFNSNCIWECELSDIKRMKTDNRPVKLEFYVKSIRDNSPRRSVGTLLLPIRNVQSLATLRDSHFKLHWHKLGALHADWRESKPEVYLLLIIVKKTIFESGQLEAMLGKKKFTFHPMSVEALSPHLSETAQMLQSQSNVYVQLLEQLGLIQVGNNPDVDCDIYNVTLTFRNLRNVAKLVDLERNYARQLALLVFQYDLLGSVSTLELNMQPSDCYAINEKISLSFKSSVRSLRTYFERIFYVPVNLFWNGVTIASFRLDFSKYLPGDSYFLDQRIWTKTAIFNFDRLHKTLSPRAPKPSVEFVFGMQLVQAYARREHSGGVPINENFTPNYDQRGAGDSYRVDPALQEKMHQWYRSFCNYDQATNNAVPAQFSQRSNTHASEILPIKQSEECKEHSADEQKICEELPVEQSRMRPQENRLPCISEKATISVAVNTDAGVCTAPSAVDTEEVAYKIVCELEDWKTQQMEHFTAQLKRKESERLDEVNERWQQERAVLQARLDAQKAQCEELNVKLTRAQAELKAQQKASPPTPPVESTQIAATVKRQIEAEYAQKFHTLEAQMQRLKTELQHKGATHDIEHKQVQIENTKLEQEKLQLNTQVEQLREKLLALEKTHISADQLKSVLNDVRMQNERFVEMEKSKQYYKDEWAKTTDELHKLKLGLIKQQKRKFAQQQAVAGGGDGDGKVIDICLEDILNDEQDALHNDRTELNSIKELLLLSSDDSCSLGDALNAEQ